MCKIWEGVGLTRGSKKLQLLDMWNLIHHVTCKRVYFFFPMADLINNTQIIKFYSTPLLVCMVAKTVKALHEYCSTVLGMFAKLRKVPTGFVKSVCPSIRMEQLGCHFSCCL
jgi:hypothetical protein